MTVADALPLATDLPMTETSLVVLALALGFTFGWLYFLYR